MFNKCPKGIFTKISVSGGDFDYLLFCGGYFVYLLFCGGVSLLTGIAQCTSHYSSN